MGQAQQEGCTLWEGVQLSEDIDEAKDLEDGTHDVVFYCGKCIVTSEA